MLTIDCFNHCIAVYIDIYTSFNVTGWILSPLIGLFLPLIDKLFQKNRLTMVLGQTRYNPRMSVCKFLFLMDFSYLIYGYSCVIFNTLNNTVIIQNDMDNRIVSINCSQ